MIPLRIFVVQNQKTLKSEEYRQLFHLPPEEVRESKSYEFCWLSAFAQLLVYLKMSRGQD